jgi:putative transposase
MSTQRQQYSAECKARVALEALKGLKTVNELASMYRVHPTQIAHWKHRLQQAMPDIVSARRDKRERDQEAQHADRYQQIGQLKVEWDGGKKKRDLPRDVTRGLLEPEHPQRSIVRQGELLGLPRATYYSHAPGERSENLPWRRLLDEQYPQTPYYGVRRLPAWLRSPGYAVNRKRVARLLHTRGLETMYPTPRLSQPHPAHRVYPSLLCGVPITRVHHVWRTDNTYSAPGWGSLPGGSAGVVEALWAVVGGVQHDGCGVLSGGVGARPGSSAPGYGQHGSGGTLPQS